MRKKMILATGLMTAWLVACGPQDETSALDGSDPVITITRASSSDDAFIDRAPAQNASKLAPELAKISDQAAKIGKIVSAVSTYGQVAVMALEMIDVLQSEADIEQARFDALHLHLDNLGVALVGVALAIARDDRLSLMRTSVNNVNLFAHRGGGRIDESQLSPSEIVELGNARTDSQFAAQNSTDISAHQGYFHEGVTNGDRCSGDSLQDWVYHADCWKSYIPARPGPNGSVAYDWRLGTAEMLQLVAARLAIIGMTDPNFRYNSERMDELSYYRSKLDSYYQKMMAGIQCWGVDGNPVNVGCVDIYTGLEVSTTFVEPSCHNPYNQATCAARIAPYKERFKRSLMSRLPLFQVRSLMDALTQSMTTNAELTTNPRIRMSGTQTCLVSVQAYDYQTNPYEPTLITDQWTAGIATCSSDVAQKWHFDRATGQIKNAWGACLGQPSFDLNGPLFGTTLWVKECTSSGGEHWTWDPSTGVLENAFHTVLGTPPQAGSGLPNPAPEVRGASATQTQRWESPPPQPGSSNDRIAMVGGTGWNTIPTLRVDIESADQGGPFFFTTNQGVPNFPSWAQDAAADAVSADFNGDGLADIALIGGTGWNTVPVALAQSSGNFSVKNLMNAAMSSFMAPANARAASGDFDGDGKGDIAMLQGGSSLVRVGFSLGDGTFTVTGGFNLGSNFQDVAAAGARLLSGDLNGDGRDDLILLGGSSSSVPMAFSNGNGTFAVWSTPSVLASWGTMSDTKIAVGDFNGDGRDDVAVTGGGGWTDIRVAFQTVTADFTTSQFPIPNFSNWSRTSGVRMVSGDYNSDGRDDLALVGGAGWASVPISFAHPGYFYETNHWTEFATWAQSSGPVRVLSGH